MGERATPRLTSDQVITILRRDGFKLAGSSGSHQKWRNAFTGKQVIVPYHRGRILPLGTMRAILSPGVEHTEEPDVGAEMLGVGGDLQQSRAARAE